MGEMSSLSRVPISYVPSGSSRWDKDGSWEYQLRSHPESGALSRKWNLS